MKRAPSLTHPDATDSSVFARVAERLKKEYGATQVIVYGSVARGEATIHSDIDLLVVAPSTEKAYFRMAHVLALIRDLSRGLPLSPVVLTPEELQERLARKDFFIQEILAEGIAL
jgi:predicted nucleotidyltransferase